ncbi:MAG: hypothetical protein NTU44_15780 [Bacteroidetes bacterium]|nr:hypothetical protein [Bacteroidota bacterium]
MKFSLSKQNCLSIFYIIFTVSLLYKFYKDILKGYSKESWQITEFLINYQGGFVRRGLFGEVLYKLHQYLSLNPYYTILFLCGLFYIILILFFARSFIKYSYPIFILPFVFFIGNPIINDFWVRKDVLLVLIFILIVYFSNKQSKINLIIINTLLIGGILIHESIFFVCAPILFLILVNKHNKKKHGIKKRYKANFVILLGLLPSLLAFISVIFCKGSYGISNAIWNSWKPIAFPISDFSQTPPAAIDGLTLSLQKGLSLPIKYTFPFFDNMIYAPIAWMFILIVIYFILTNVDQLNVKIFKYNPQKYFNKYNLSNILTLQFISIIPLFILGSDYARWIFYWTSTSFACILLIPESVLAEIFPKWISSCSFLINTFLDSMLVKSKGFVVLLSLFIGIPQYTWNLSTYMGSNAIVIVMRFISSVIYKIMSSSGFLN